MLASSTVATAASFRSVPNTDPGRLKGDPYLYLVATRPHYQNIDLHQQADGDLRQSLFMIATITSISKTAIKATCTQGNYVYDARTGRRSLEVQKFAARPMTPATDLSFSMVYRAILGQEGPLRQSEGIGSVCLLGEKATNTLRQTVRPGTYSYETFPFQIAVSTAGATAKPK